MNYQNGGQSPSVYMVKFLNKRSNDSKEAFVSYFLQTVRLYVYDTSFQKLKNINKNCIHVNLPTGVQ